MSVRTAPINTVAAFNPTPPKIALSGVQESAFVPMAAVFEDGSMQVREHKSGSAISNGYSYFQNGDVLVAKITPCFENNKIAVARIDREHGFGSTEFHVIRPDLGKLDARYLSYFLRQDSVREFGQKRMTGSAGQRRVPRQFLEQLEIPLPPLDEQRRIAATLEQADTLRRMRQEALDRINQLGDAIFFEMFGDISTNPMNWDTVRLGDLCDVRSSKRVFVEEFVAEGVPFYRGTEVGKLAEGEVIRPDLFIASSHYDQLVNHSGRPEIGDLLLPSICHDGRIWRVDSEEPFYFKDGRVLWIRTTNPSIDSEYLKNHLRNAFLRNYEAIASGTTFAELKIVNLKGLSILLPPIRLQKEFSDRLRRVERCRTRLVLAKHAADALFASLQHRAYRGEL